MSIIFETWENIFVLLLLHFSRSVFNKTSGIVFLVCELPVAIFSTRWKFLKIQMKILQKKTESEISIRRVKLPILTFVLFSVLLLFPLLLFFVHLFPIFSSFCSPPTQSQNKARWKIRENSAGDFFREIKTVFLKSKKQATKIGKVKNFGIYKNFPWFSGENSWISEHFFRIFKFCHFGKKHYFS